jgi:transposase
MVDKDVIIARLLRQNEQLTHQVQLFTEQVQQLQKKIARLEKNSSNSSKPPSSDIISPKPPAENGRRRKHGGQKGHEKYTRQLFPEEAIDKTIVHELPKDEIEHKKLIALDQTELVLQQVDLPEKLYTVTEHRVRLYRKPDGTIIRAKLPKHIRKSGFFSPRMTAFVGYLKARGHMSYSTLQAFFDDVINLDISSGYLVKCCTHKLSPALIPSYEEALQYSRNAPIVGSDETGHKNPAYKSIWTWC